ncbi:hypothetical protein MBFIL_01440 [Methanobrevibacter filiformis]|uniref:Uncharacterized protein n=1 Tax=Methanobrevibacter filiformis TaxID=55758 RepID=A0A166FB24_9EURY|nr:hypothetical protein MBFIL_01440 [Methanobrevibacter filiformis]
MRKAEKINLIIELVGLLIIAAQLLIMLSK